MDENQLKELLAKFKDEAAPLVKSLIGDAVTGFITSDILNDRLKDLGANTKAIEDVLKVVETQGIELNKLINGRGKRTIKTVEEYVKEAFPTIQKNVSDNGGRHKFQIVRDIVRKTAVSLTSITSDPFGMMLPDLAVVQSQKNAIAPSLNPFTLTPDDHGVIYWVDQTTRTNNAAARSDGSAAAEQVYAWTGYSETVDNISAMVPVHKEALKHISVMEQTIRELLNDDCQVALDGYCYTGTGTAPQIGGLYTRASAFVPATYITAGGFAPKSANIYDLIVAMRAQIQKATKYNVDTVWMNPYDALQLKLSKDGNNNYLAVPFAIGAGGSLTVDNMKVIEANSVTVNTLVVGDSTKARLYNTGNVEIEIGYDLTGDFSKRILTILANMEVSLLIRNAEVDAFLKSTDILSNCGGITGSGQ